MIRKLYMLACCLAIIFQSNAQGEGANKFPGVDNIIQPSPNAASLGKFGGFEVTKYTGSINKAIEILNLSSGDLNYSVSLAYSSNGIKVDDWGSQTGIGWTIGSHATITREVRGIPDELAQYSVKDLDPGVWYPDNSTNLERIKSLSGMHANFYDGEFDLFHYNIFGRSGSFIIVNNTVKLLTHTDKLKITISNSFPWTFEFTAPNGTKFTFGNPGSTEQSMGDYENPCEIGQGHTGDLVPTAWYIDQIISPKGDLLNFTYEKSSIPLRMLRAFEQKTIFKWRVPEMGDNIICQEIRDNLSLGNEEVSCAKFRYLYPCILKSVTSTDFTVQYDYMVREDLYAQKLLTDINIKDRSNALSKSIHFSYQKTTSSQPVEDVLRLSINSPDYQQQIKIRYFLNDVTFKDRNLVAINNYSFLYNNPAALPHRYSFAQDLAGFYNGILNSHFIPHKEASEYANAMYPPPVQYSLSRTGFRQVDHAYSSTGLLTRITYPTGGYDSVVYEPHSRISRRNVVAPLVVYSGSVTNNTTQQMEGQTTSFIAQKDEMLTVTFNSDWDGPTPPVDDEGDDYYCHFLMNNITDMEGDYPPGDGPGSTRVGHLKSTNITLQVIAGKEYNFTIVATGYKTKGVVTLYRASAPDMLERYTELLPGHRVKKDILASGLDYQEIGYEYNHFTESLHNGRKVLVLTDSASANVAGYFNSFGDSYLSLLSEFCDANGGHTIYVPQQAKFHYVTSAPKYNQDVYMGSYIAYTHLLKRYKGGEGNDGFEATVTSINSNEGGGVIRGDYTPYIPISNLGWNNGLEKFVYQGGVKENKNYVQNIKTNYYIKDNLQDKLYYNYSAFKSNPAAAIPIYSNEYYYMNFLPYSVIYYPLLSTWYKLDQVKIQQFDDQGRMMEDLTAFEYSPVSGLLKKTTKQNSDQTNTIIRTMYVDDSESPETNSTINNYLTQSGWYGIPLQTVTTKGVSSKSSRLEYVISNGYPALSKVSEWQNNSPARVTWKALSYQTKNRLAAYEDAAGIKHQFIWDATVTNPVAHISGSVMVQGYYTSFEEFDNTDFLIGSGNTINSSTSFSGKKSLAINGTVTCQGLNNTKEYQITLWSKNGTPQYTGYNGTTAVEGPSSGWQQLQTKDGWTLLQKNLTGITRIVIAGNAVLLDEMRIVPIECRMETFTYEGLTGVTSKVDQNHTASHFEYDAFDRLLRIRDADRNILKQFDYKYKTGVGCTGSANWQNTGTPPRCIKINNQNTGETEQEQKDLEPCSPTYNQIRWVSAGTNVTSCPLPRIYVKMETLDRNQGMFGDVIVSFYSDAQGTVAASASNLTLLWSKTEYNSKTNSSSITHYSTVVNGNSVTLLENTELLVEWTEQGEEEMLEYYRNFIYKAEPNAAYEIVIIE